MRYANDSSARYNPRKDIGAMFTNGESEKPPRNMDERLEALTAIVHDIVFSSQKLHANMLASRDSQMQQLTAKIDKLAESSARNTENIQARTENAGRLDIKFERHLEIMTGLLQKQDERK